MANTAEQVMGSTSCRKTHLRTPHHPAFTAMHPLPYILICGNLPEEWADSSVCCHLEQAAPVADAVDTRLMESAVWLYPAYEAGVGRGGGLLKWQEGMGRIEQQGWRPWSKASKPQHHPIEHQGTYHTPHPGGVHLGTQGALAPKLSGHIENKNVLLWDPGLEKGLRGLKSPSHRLSIVFA